MRALRNLGLSLVTVLVACSSVRAATPVSALPDFSPLLPYTTFGNFHNDNLVTINGNVGVSNNGKWMAPNAEINGSVYLGPGVTKSIGAPTKISGSVFQPIDLSVPQSLVFTASNILKNLAADYTLGDVKTAQTFNAIGSGMVTVIDMNSLSLGGSSNITLNGGPNDFFVLNVSGKVALNGSASIVGSGAVDASHILINLYDSSGNLGTVAHVGNVINGSILIPFDSGTFHSMNGAIWSGNGEITLMSGATVTGKTLVPEPSIAWLLGLGGLAGYFRLRKGRR